ncbi:hypothetical protein LBMAG40_09840 [Cyanobium sp.]|nr:hypothetical protein LBMAG40_09840 [Cyanobium sp.]
MLWQMQKVPGIGSEAVGAGNSVGITFDALPQLAAEAKGSGGAKGGQGAGSAIRFIFDDEREYRPRSVKLYYRVVNSVIPAPLIN